MPYLLQVGQDFELVNFGFNVVNSEIFARLTMLIGSPMALTRDALILVDVTLVAVAVIKKIRTRVMTMT